MQAGRSLRVAVLGSSEPRAGEPEYEQARELGRLLGAAGYTVLTGGYGGVMEGASRGSREGGGRTLGVTCRLFNARSPNRYLDEMVESDDLHARTRELIDRADGFVVLPGKAGTLSELTFLWALHRAGCLGSRPVVLLGEPWNGFPDELVRKELLSPSQAEMTDVEKTPEGALRALRRRMQPTEESRA